MISPMLTIRDILCMTIDLRREGTFFYYFNSSLGLDWLNARFTPNPLSLYLFRL